MTEPEEPQAEAVDYDITPLLQPLQVRGLQLRNRFVMPGMQRYWCADGAPDQRLREYYRRRVLGGVSLVISESCAVDHPSATKNPTFARISPGTCEAWRACVAGVHKAGGAMFLQLWHQGAVNYGGDADSNPAFVALSPSGLSHPGESFGRAATEAELDSLKRAFVQGALDAQQIGTDGVELHSAHGFLLDQFLWPGTNLRTDRYGGPSITGRATFVAEVTQAVREATGPDFAISIRISQWKESDYDAKIVEEPGRPRAADPHAPLGGSRHLPRVDAAVLDARVGRLGPRPGGLGEVVHRRAGHRRRQRRPRHRRDGLTGRPGRPADRGKPGRRAGAPLPARRLRPGLGRPQPDRRSGVGREGGRSPDP